MTSHIFQGQNVELSEEVKRLKESQEEQQRALRALEEASTKMETEKIKQHAESVSHYFSVIQTSLKGLRELRAPFCVRVFSFTAEPSS